MNNYLWFQLMNAKTTDIAILLKQISEGDSESFKILYAKYKEVIYTMIKRRVPDPEEAKDVAQDIFVHLWCNRQKLSGIQNFDTWIYAVVRNNVISNFRKKNIRIHGEQFLAGALGNINWDSEAMVIAKELDLKIQDIVKSMSPNMQKCYYLSRKEGLDNHEIATLLALSEKTVRNNLYEASKKLKTALKPHYPEFLLFLSILDCI